MRGGSCAKARPPKQTANKVQSCRFPRNPAPRAAGWALLHRSPRQERDILFLVSDNQTLGAVGCYGNEDVITPNLERLAGEGVRFLNHYNTTSICTASRSSMMTGLYECRHGCNFDSGNMERRFLDQSYPVKRRQAGYFIRCSGKISFNGEGEEFGAFEKQFDGWEGGPRQTFYETQNRAVRDRASVECPRYSGLITSISRTISFTYFPS